MKRVLLSSTILSVVALGALSLLVGRVSAETFTLEQILSAPFPSELVAAPNAGKIAWTQDADGRHSLWAAAAPDYRARQIAGFDEDDGQEITGLVFGSGASYVAFVRGGDPNRNGEIPNPVSDPKGEDQSVWIARADGSENAKKLAEGVDPAFSPDGKTLALVDNKNAQIWTVPTAGAGEPKPLARTRGRAGSLRWSPDGTYLAFVSRRGDHGFIGVYSFAKKTLRYLDPGLGHDTEPVWSPDGKRIAFIRQPNERNRLPFFPRRSALPWSIRIADVETGTGRLVWEADEGTGSAFHEIVAANQLLWAKGDHIVFPWEREGFVHLYSVPASGGEATLLTPGQFEVEHVTLTADGADVFYSSNQNDTDRRHLWQVSASGGTPRAVTSGGGLEWSPVAAGDGSAVAYLASDARLPAHPMIRVGSEPARALAPATVPTDFPSDLVVPEPVVFSAADGMKIHGQLFVPKDARSGDRRPAIVFFHGGSRRQMLLGWHYMYYYHNAYAMNQYLASRGYVVLSVNYRSGIGYGMEFREALDYGARGASEYRDVVGAGLYLRSRNDVDPARIALWGGSYGGYLTAMGLSRASDPLRRGCRHPRSPRLERRHQKLRPRVRGGETSRRRAPRVRVLADGVGRRLALARAPHPWR